MTPPGEEIFFFFCPSPLPLCSFWDGDIMAGVPEGILDLVVTMRLESQSRMESEAEIGEESRS